ncbi:DMT family transporter [Roseobacter litoralis]|uniref:DMT family transporter n=1 Tax=Roseobacter litoralis TaxID=42443 RepID=UPI0024942FE0|nr:DMT family transporter [Roseobacter litoralis]
MTALGLGLMAAFCWGLHDIAIRYLSRSVPLLAALFVVLCVGALFQLTAILILGGGFFVSGTGVLLSLGAGVAFLIASLGLYYAFERGPVRLVAPIIASFPILSLVYAVASGRTVTPAQGLAVLAIVVGVGLVAALSDQSDDDIPPIKRTIILSLVSAFGFATTFKLGQLAADLSGELPTTLIARLTALSLLMAVIMMRRATFWPGRKALLPLVGMGILDGVALLSVLSAGKMPNPEYASVTSSMFGLLTILLAWTFLKERMTPPQWSGCLIAFAGVGYLAL